MKKNKRKQVGVNRSSGAEKVENIAQKDENLALGMYDAAALGGLSTPTVGYDTGNPITPPLLVNEAVNGMSTDEQRPKTEREIIEEKRKRASESKTVRMLNERRRKKEIQAQKERANAERRINQAQKQHEKTQNGNGGNGNGGNGNRNNGNGGWIAAVSILGATTLALGAVVTVGAIDMRDSRRGMACGHQSNLYELIALVEYADSDLDRVRVSNSPAQQSRILTDLLVQTRLAENVLEKLPVDSQSDSNLTSFLNRASSLCERLLSKLREGQVLDERDFEELERTYDVNKKTRDILDNLMGKYKDEDWLEYLKDKGKDAMSSTLKELENATLDENKIKRDAVPDVPADATQRKQKQAKLNSKKAEELCRAYFSDYKIASIELQSETTSHKIEAYNFLLKDENGLSLYAQLSESDGELIAFDYYEHCVEHNLDLDNAKSIAENFLEKLGKDNMTAVKVNEMGTTASFTFVYEQDDVVYYPDSIEVKVCEQKGVVVGYNASRYLKHHRERSNATANLSLAEAQAKLSPKLQLEGSRVAMIATKRGEKLAYEFACSYDGQTYFVYIDAQTGDELSIINAVQMAK